MATSFHDKRWMAAALGAARSSLGRSGANPAVGCALVTAAGDLCAVGSTALGGRPHAETVALAKVAPEVICGGTAYVTLEPCAHQGETGPCAKALVEAGLARVVIGIQDPDPRVNGGGITMLQEAGIEVELGVCAAEVTHMLAGFLTRVTTNKPFVTVKAATSLDGMIALADGAQRWLTGPEMRRFVHLERSYHDGILTGIGTVLADNPSLTCRVPGLEQDSPHRFVMDSQLRCPPEAALFDTDIPVTLFCAADAPKEREAALAAAGAVISRQETHADGRVALGPVLHAIAGMGCNNLMVEAGPGLITAFVSAKSIDRLVWTQSHHIIGSDGIPSIGPLNAVELQADMHYMHGTTIGADRVQVFSKAPA